nr:prepilin-type N-terminal cleavage/methylation domain-containing protein [Microbacterium bovistercoris]
MRDERRGTGGTDAGFSIVEVIIAMFLLAVIALALLPLLVGVTRSSVTNKSLVAATSLANAQLAPIRSQFPNTSTGTNQCSDVRAKSASAVPGPAGSGLLADVVVAACPTTFPDTVTVTVKVYKSGAPSQILAAVPTKILVTQ